MKRCWRCKTEKPKKDFVRNKAKRDGLSDECQSCRRISKHQYYFRHSTAIKEKVQKWRFQNIERKRDIAKKWRAANRDRLLAEERQYRFLKRDAIRKWFKGWYQRNKNQQKRRAAEWYKAHAAKAQARIKLWRIANREKCLLYSINGQARRIARKRGGKVTKVDLQAILLRDRGRCYLCARHVTRKTLSFDHVMPLAKGGAHSPDNLRVAHRRCNIRKHTKVFPLQQELAL
ncbi:MAG: HNH endonuclease [Nitrospinota bacterium]